MKATLSRSVSSAILILLLSLGFGACRSLPAQVSEDLERLQGFWEGRGPGGPCSVTISGNSLRYTQPSADSSRPKFWYETTFTLPGGTDPKQLHATIVENVHQDDIGTVVVTIFKIDDETLTLGVVKDFEEPPTEPVVGDWEWAFDQYHFERAQPSEGNPSRP